MNLRLYGLLILLALAALACNLTGQPVAPDTATPTPETLATLPNDQADDALGPTITPLTTDSDLGIVQPSTNTPIPTAPPVIVVTATPRPTTTPIPTARPVVVVTATPAPDRVRFPAGGTGTILQGQAINAGGERSYLLEAQAGQLMQISASEWPATGPNNLSLAVYRADSGQLIGQGTADLAYWSGTLPASTDYRVVVTNRGAAQTFSLQVRIPRRIAFEPDPTGTVINGQLTSTNPNRYVLEVNAGQMLQASVTSSSGVPVWLEIVGQRAGSLLRSGSRISAWLGEMPMTDDYLITVLGDGATAYTLNLTAPQRIRFARGTTSTLLSGDLSDRTHDYYVLEAGAGQHMRLGIDAHGANAWLTVTGADGQSYLRSVTRQSDWNGDLFTTQDYFITVESDGTAGAYSLMATIPQRINFAPGATSTTIAGTVSTASPSRQYILEAAAGQRLTVEIDSPNDDVLLTIYGRDGIPLVRYQSGAARYDDILPASQDYIIVAVATALTTSPTYTITVSVTG
jgi:hypothetical protein